MMICKPLWVVSFFLQNFSRDIPSPWRATIRHSIAVSVASNPKVDFIYYRISQMNITLGLQYNRTVQRSNEAQSRLLHSLLFIYNVI